MCRGLSHDCGLGLTCPLCDDTNLIFARKFFDFFAAVVVENSFPSSLEVRNHRCRCCVSAWGSCANYRCNEVALEFCPILEFFFTAQAYGSVKCLTC
jgi:hypothetical protein